MAKTSTEAVTPTAEILAATLVDQGLALVLGWADRILPETGTLAFAGAAEPSGTVRLHLWPRSSDDGGATHWFLAVMETAEAMRIAAAKVALVSPNGRMRYTLPVPPSLSLDAADLLARLVPLAQGACGSQLLAFLQDTLAGREPVGRQRAALLFACLARFAEPDGFIEIFGRADAATLLLQGWSVRLAAGAAELVLEADDFRLTQAAIATYDRPDLGASARGILAVVPAAGIDLRGIRGVFFRKGDAWHRLEVFENRRFLADDATTPHLKGLFPALRLEPVTAPLFKRLCGNRYEGFETVTALTVPVRAALDLSVAAPGAGIFLTGWVLDPEDRVAAISLRSSAGFRQRLDEAWHRTIRRDVSEGYGRDALFAGRLRPGGDSHGFVVSVPCQPDPQASWYLEIALADDECAFLPVPLGSPTTGAIRQMLSSVDIRDPAAEGLIRRQVGPLVTASAAHATPSRRAVVACSFGPPLPRQRGGQRPRVTAVLPLLHGGDDFDINLARLAADPEMEAIELLVVTPEGPASSLGTSLQRHARFYGRSGRLVVSPDDIDACDALELGADAASSDLLLFLSPSVFPKRTGWLSQLTNALAASDKAAAICPTLVYEDDSIRYAGLHSGTAPGRTEMTRFAGYARHWLGESGPGAAVMPVRMGTLECCLIQRNAFRELGGFARDYVGVEMKGPDFFLRMRAAKQHCLWMPAVEMIALDDPAEAAPPAYWMQTAKLVDEWGFARKWGKSAANS
jgi:O-antigen biosynthesis protein